MEDKVYLKVDGMIIKAGNDTDLVNYANAEGLEDYEIVDGLRNGDTVYINSDITAVVSVDNGVDFDVPKVEYRIFVHSIEKDEEEKQRLMDLGLPLNGL